MADQQVPAGDVAKLWGKAADTYIISKVDVSPAAQEAAAAASEDCIKAIRNGGGLADSDTILQKLTELAEAVTDVKTAVTDVKTELAELKAKVDTTIKLANDTYNLAARASNTTATIHIATLEALRNAAGDMSPSFPTTIGGMHKLSAGCLNELSEFYGVPFGRRDAAVGERVKEFEKFIRRAY